jgi:Double-GTPase 2
MPAIYLVLFVVWLALMAVEIVVIAPAALAVALLATAGASIGRLYLAAWRTLTPVKTTGPSPVAPDEESDPAFPHYLLVQVWRDLAVVIEDAFPWSYRTAMGVVTTLTGTMLNGTQWMVLFPIWLGLCLGIALAVVPWAIAVAVLALIVGVVVGIGLAGWLVCVLVLGAVERIWMAYRRILLACPHPYCYQRFALPEYACPNCEARHRRLAPSRLGAWQHVCRCGMRLPTTIFLGRFRLAAYCPHCKRRLPGRIGRARVEPLPFVGGPAAGKTTLMFLAVRALRATAAASGGSAEFVEARHARAYLSAVAELGRGEQLAKTGPELPMATMVDLALPSAGHRILYLFDPAGEHYTGATQVEALRYLDHGESLLFVIDPFALPELQRAMSSSDSDLVTEATATSEEDPSDTLARVLAELRSREDHGRQRRIAVVVTKTDVLRKTTAAGELSDVRAWLTELGLGNTIRTLEQTAAEVRYFASGLDSSPAELAALFGWAAGLSVNGDANLAFDDTPSDISLQGPRLAGRPPGRIPLSHQIGRWTLMGAIAVLGPVSLTIIGFWIATGVH